MFPECLTDYGTEPTAYFSQETHDHYGGFPCTECKKDIEEEEKIELVTANYEGTWMVYVTCATCLAIRRSLYKGDFCHGRMWDNIREAYGVDLDGIDEDWVPPDGLEVNDV